LPRNFDNNNNEILISAMNLMKFINRKGDVHIYLGVCVRIFGGYIYIISFFKAHGILFKQKFLTIFNEYNEKFLFLFDNSIDRVIVNWREQGV
jgi:hypothetical protein